MKHKLSTTKTGGSHKAAMWCLEHSLWIESSCHSLLQFLVCSHMASVTTATTAWSSHQLVGGSVTVPKLVDISMHLQ